MKILISDFEKKGLNASPHVQLNIAWGNIISDVDLIVQNDDSLIGIEIKSKQDNFKHAFLQIDKIRDFFNVVYIASDNSREYLEKKWIDDSVGLIHIENERVVEIKNGKQLLDYDMKLSTLLMLKKICLSRLAQISNSKKTGTKHELARNIFANIQGKQLKSILKSIALCEKNCEGNCPIWNFEKTLFTPLLKIEKIFKSYKVTRTLPLIPAKTIKEKTKS